MESHDRTEANMTLEEARKRARYSQEQVASIMGCSRPTIARMERHPEDVSVADAKRLSALYGVPVPELFFMPEDCS